MFTGLIQTLGSLEAAEARGRETRLRIRADFDGYRRGESIAVNGVCLTVEESGQGWFAAYASAETLSVTSLGGLKAGSQVNLERALAMGDRLGGHLVSGHVDCLAEVAEVSPAGESKIFRLTFPAEQAAFVVAKGSVALDGVSLTVNACGPDWLSVNIIPATQRETTIGSWRAGRKVNMETDLIGKYVQRMVAPFLEGKGPASKAPGMTRDFLLKHGF